MKNQQVASGFITVCGKVIQLAHITSVNTIRYTSGSQIHVHLTDGKRIDLRPFDQDISKSGEFSKEDGAWKFYEWLMAQGERFETTEMTPVGDLFETEEGEV